MSSASVDFKFLMDTFPSGKQGATPEQDDYWTHVIAQPTWSSADSESDPPVPYHIVLDLYPSGAPALSQQIADARALLALVADEPGDGFFAGFEAIYGETVKDALLAIIMDNEGPNERAHAFAHHLPFLDSLVRRLSLIGGA